MGCFDETCVASGIPISSGDPVYAVITRQNTSDGGSLLTSGCCHISDYFMPAMLPIKGVYNDYGSIEDCEPKWYHTKFLEQINKGLVPIDYPQMPAYLKVGTKVKDRWGKPVNDFEPCKTIEELFMQMQSCNINHDGKNLAFVLVKADIYEAYQTMAAEMFPDWMGKMPVRSVIARDNLHAIRNFPAFITDKDVDELYALRSGLWGGFNGLGHFVGDRFIDDLHQYWNALCNSKTDEFDGIIDDLSSFIKFASVMDVTGTLWIRRPSSGQSRDMKYKIQIEQFHVDLMKRMRKERRVELGYDDDSED